jgi:hypothetical protein
VADLAGKPQANGLIVTDLPANKLGSFFAFKVRVVTDYTTTGIDGPISEPFLLAGKPARPPTPPTRDDSTNNMQIVLNVATVAQDNGTPIRSYHIEIDNGMGGAFTEIQGFQTNSMLLKATKSLGIYPGLYYRVRYRVKNAIGWSEFSDITYILSARRPDTPVPPTITLWQGTKVRVVFYLPFNGGSEITKGYVELKGHDGVTYETEPQNCDVTIDSIFDSRVCIIPLSILRGPVWNLQQGDSIVARVKFENEIGLSLFSGDTVVPVLMPFTPHFPQNGPRRVNA